MTQFQEKAGVLRGMSIKKALRQSLRTNRAYERVRKDSYCGGMDRQFCEPAEFCRFIEKIDELMGKGQIVKSLKSSKSTYVSYISWKGKDIVVKRYNYKGVIHSFRHTIKKSRARHSWLYSHRLGMLNIPTSKPLAYIEMYWGPFLKKSYFICEYLEAQSLYAFLHDETIGQEEYPAAARKVSVLLQHMGKHKIFHGDLKLNNILLTNNEAIIVDLDGMKAHKWNWIYRFWCAKDLALFAKYLHDYPAFEALLHNLLYEKG